MNEMLLVYITCNSMNQAHEIAQHLITHRLCACVNIFPETQSIFFWPPCSDKIEHTKEVILVAKTIESKYQQLEDEVHRFHTDQVPCVFAIPVKHVAKKYSEWLIGEMLI